MWSSLLPLPIRSGVCRIWTPLWTTVVWVRDYFWNTNWFCLVTVSIQWYSEVFLNKYYSKQDCYVCTIMNKKKRMTVLCIGVICHEEIPPFKINSIQSFSFYSFLFSLHLSSCQVSWRCVCLIRWRMPLSWGGSMLQSRAAPLPWASTSLWEVDRTQAFTML